jgi:exopolyphosphatase/guanosine-5'-triphosphate,3'-diphosphate pyrophosphatase
LPLGALRLSDRFLKSDPPTRGEIRALKAHVYAALDRAGVRPLLADERMLGTGGTARNLGKVDRRMRGEYPISRLHGYVVARRRLDEVANALASAPASNRATMPGLNADRADSIVGGALVVQAVMDRLLASDLTVAGYGLREGIALRSVTQEAPSIDQVQQAAIAALAGRFSAEDPQRANRRAALTRKLLATLAPGLSAEASLAASSAASLLDVGASIDYYRRHAHTARIVCDANLDGYSHRTLALVAAAAYAVGEREASVKAFAPLLGVADLPVVERMAAAVALADAVVRYGSGDPETSPLERTNGHAVLAAPLVDAWPLDAPVRRAERAFGVSFEFGDTARVS